MQNYKVGGDDICHFSRRYLFCQSYFSQLYVSLYDDESQAIAGFLGEDVLLYVSPKFQEDVRDKIIPFFFYEFFPTYPRALCTVHDSDIDIGYPMVLIRSIPS